MKKALMALVISLELLAGCGDSPVGPDSQSYSKKSRLAKFDLMIDSTETINNKYFIAGSLVSEDSVPIYGITIKCQLYDGISDFISGKELESQYAITGVPVDNTDVLKGIIPQDTLHPKEKLRWCTQGNAYWSSLDTIYALCSATIPAIEYWEEGK
jgi:hypothetical protein